MSTPHRGDIYWVDLNPSQGAEINKVRPGIILSATPINKARKTVVIIPISSSPHPNPPLTVPIQSNDKMAVAVIDQIRTVDKNRLRELIGSLTFQEMTDVEDALRQVLVIP